MRIRYKNKIDKERRDIIKTISAAGISPGLLRASSLVGGMMVARATEAQNGPNKSILLLAVGGAISSRWAPNGNTLGPMSAAYAPVKGDVQFLVGGSMSNAGHGIMFERFTGGSDLWTTDSFDVNVGKTIGANRQVKYLNVGVESGATNLSRDAGAAVPTIDSPVTAFNRLFGSGGGGGGGGDTGPDPRIKFVDAHKAAIDALRVKLGQHERERLDSHVASIEEFEASISSNNNNNPPPASCGNVSQPAGSTSSDFDTVARAQIEVAMLALKCDITSSVSISFGNDQHAHRIPGYADVMHQSHHCCGHTDFYDITANYMSSLVARTISRTKEEGLLGSTIITQVTDMGDGRSHGNSGVPFTIAGGGINTGGNTNMSGKTQLDTFAAVSRRLGVDQDPAGKTWTNSPISL